MRDEQVISEIIKEQGQIIGDELARTMALNSGAVKFNSSSLSDVSLSVSDPKEALRKVINSYKTLFGQASVEVCLGVAKKYYGDLTDLGVNAI